MSSVVSTEPPPTGTLPRAIAASPEADAEVAVREIPTALEETQPQVPSLAQPSSPDQVLPSIEEFLLASRNVLQSSTPVEARPPAANAPVTQSGGYKSILQKGREDRQN